MRSKLTASLLALALLVPAAAAAVNTGSADFTRYYALGDSLTAGFQSGSLYDFSQKTSFPSLIELQATGSNSSFALPLVTFPGIPGVLQLHNLVPPFIAPSPTLGHPENVQFQGIYNDIAVPGETVHSMINTVTDNGGLHDLILRHLGSQLQLGVGAASVLVTECRAARILGAGSGKR